MGTQFSLKIHIMSGVKDVKPIEFITAFADFLKSKNVEVPEWASYVKAGAFKELGTQEDDWYFTRMAGVCPRSHRSWHVQAHLRPDHEAWIAAHTQHHWIGCHRSLLPQQPRVPRLPRA